MALYLCPRVAWDNGASYLWLPPWFSAVENVEQTVVVREPAFGDAAIISAIQANRGAQITINVDDYLVSPQTQANALNWKRVIWAACKGRLVRLNIWSDEGWGECALKRLSFNHTRDPLVRLRDFNLQFHATTSEPSTDYAITFDDYDDDYPYADVVGRPTGDAATGTPVEDETMRVPFGGKFFGQQSAVTAAGNEHVFTIGGAAGGSWKITKLQITHADKFEADGTTTVTVSDMGVGGGGSTITASIGSTAQSSSLGSGSFNVAVGTDLKVFITAAGNHQNVEFKFECEPL